MPWFPNPPLSAEALPVGAATEVQQLQSNVLLQSLVNAPPPAVGGGLTDAQLRASPVDVNVSTAQLPPLASTSALQLVGNTSLNAINGKLPALIGGRIPVVLPAGGTGLTDTELRASAVPVSLSGSVAVTGTFWQATQPVSIATMPSTPVTGTFWQATQPVSIASLPTTAVTGPLTDTELRASAVPVSIAAALAVTGAFWQATQPVSAAALPLPSGASTSALQGGGLPSVLASDRLKVDGSGVTQPVSGPLTDTQLRATPVQVIERMQSTRQSVSITLFEFAIAGTAEVLNTMSFSVAGAATTTGTSYAVPASKVLRITSISAMLSSVAGNTTAKRVIIRVRMNAAGAAIITSPLQIAAVLPGLADAGNAGPAFGFVIPDGLELPAGAGLGFTTEMAGYVVTVAAPKVTITALGYLYDA